MRILMLTQFYPPILGGEENHVRSLSLELAARGHEVAVATLWHAGMPEFELDRGVRVYRVCGSMQRLAVLFSEPGRNHAPPFPDPELMLALGRIIRQERPQIIHAHNWLLHSFLPLKAWSKARLIVSLHDFSLRCATKNLMYHETAYCSGPGLKKCLGCAAHHYGPLKGGITTVTNWLMSSTLEKAGVDLFLAVSQATADGNAVGRRGWPVQVIPNFIEDELEEQQEEVQSYLAQLPEQDFLLFVGDLRLFKGIDILLKAYAGLRDAPPLVLIGRECADTPADFPAGVRVLKSWPRQAVLQAWKRSLFGLLPSVGPETFGIVVIEAMANGKPVIASRIGGLPDIIVDGESGYLVPPGDVEVLRQAIIRLLSDQDLRERMGQAARRRAELFQASRIIPRIEQIYQQIFQNRASSFFPVQVEPGIQKESL